MHDADRVYAQSVIAECMCVLSACETLKESDMRRGWLQMLLENATPTLVLAAIVLGAGVAYGVYERQQVPFESVEAAVPMPAQVPPAPNH